MSTPGLDIELGSVSAVDDVVLALREVAALDAATVLAAFGECGVSDEIGTIVDSAVAILQQLKPALDELDRSLEALDVSANVAGRRDRIALER